MSGVAYTTVMLELVHLVMRALMIYQGDIMEGVIAVMATPVNEDAALSAKFWRGQGVR